MENFFLCTAYLPIMLNKNSIIIKTEKYRFHKKYSKIALLLEHPLYENAKTTSKEKNKRTRERSPYHHVSVFIYECVFMFWKQNSVVRVGLAGLFANYGAGCGVLLHRIRALFMRSEMSDCHFFT